MKEINTAIVGAQAEYLPIPKNRTVKYQTRSGEMTYAYADHASINKSIAAANAKHKLAITQQVDVVDGLVQVKTIILHESGEQLVGGTIAFPIAGDVKALGSLITYLRRYSLSAALNLTADDDDDAEGVPEVPQDPNEVHHRIVALGNVASEEDLRADTKSLINKYPYAKERVIRAATKIHNERFATPNNEGVINEPAAE